MREVKVVYRALVSAEQEGQQCGRGREARGRVGGLLVLQG